MPKYRANGFCVSCGCRKATGYKNASSLHLHRYTPPAGYSGKHNQVCNRCAMRKISKSSPYVAVSNIKKAGNGLFAHRNFNYNEIVCTYTGTTYDSPPQNNSDYIVEFNNMFIDGKLNGGLGRYINEHPQGLNNVRFSLANGSLVVRVVSKNYAMTHLGHDKSQKYGVTNGSEFYIGYGNSYWKDK
jgi:hypothetical protein